VIYVAFSIPHPYLVRSLRSMVAVWPYSSSIMDNKNVSSDALESGAPVICNLCSLAIRYCIKWLQYANYTTWLPIYERSNGHIVHYEPKRQCRYRTEMTKVARRSTLLTFSCLLRESYLQCRSFHCHTQGNVLHYTVDKSPCVSVQFTGSETEICDVLPAFSCIII
jgi:hypothetical protein